jgi:hypothetical protein
MKWKIAALSVAAVLAAAFHTPALATTYNYVGNPFTSNDAPGVGSNVTGTVTFDFDTSGFTGQLHQVDVSNLVMTSGIYSFNLTTSANTQFDLTLGVITDWHVDSGTPPFFTGYAVQALGLLGAGGFEQDDVLFYTAGQYFGPGAFVSCNDGCVQHGWTEAAPSATPLPAALPLFASGLGALGFARWRRKRKVVLAA